jgi:hypothetical protein
VLFTRYLTRFAFSLLTPVWRFADREQWLIVRGSWLVVSES